MALFDTTPAHTPDTPVRWDILGAVALCILFGFLSVVMTAVQAGGPENWIEKGTLYSAGGVAVVAPACLYQIYRKGSFVGFVLSVGFTLMAFLAATVAFSVS